MTTTDNERTIHDLEQPTRRRPRVFRDALRLLLSRTRARVEAGARAMSTLEMQRDHARYLLERIPPRTPLERLTPKRIAAVLSAEGTGRRGWKLSGGTLRKRASTLRQSLELARGRAPRLPEIPYRYKPRPEHLPDYASYCALRDALPPHRRRWFVVAIWTGQRASDVERMRREDLDVDRQQVAVRSTKTRRFAPRWVHAAPELLRELAPHWRTLPCGAKLVAPWGHVSSQLTRLSERLGLPLTTAQRLRHTLITWFVAANGFTAELLELGGWRDMTVPSLVYAHAAPKRLQEQIERTYRLAVGSRRAPKASRKRDREPTAAGNPADDSGGATLAGVAPPKPAHVGPCEREQDGAAAARSPDVTIPTFRGSCSPVGAEGIEPSTNGLRVRSAGGTSCHEPCGPHLGSPGERPCPTTTLPQTQYRA